MGKNRSFAYADRAAAVIADPAHAVGRIKKAYGTRAADDTMNGELLGTLYDTFPESVDTTEPLWVEIDSLAVPLFIAAVLPAETDSEIAVLKIDGDGRLTDGAAQCIHWDAGCFELCVLLNEKKRSEPEPARLGSLSLIHI